MDVFSAVADPTRRWLLGCLRTEGPQTVTDLAKPLPISRQAVTKHLDLLETAGLVAKEIRGRERVHRLCPEPLVVVDRWLEPYSAAWDERLSRLKVHLDKEPNGGPNGEPDGQSSD